MVEKMSLDHITQIFAGGEMSLIVLFLGCLVCWALRKE